MTVYVSLSAEITHPESTMGVVAMDGHPRVHTGSGHAGANDGNEKLVEVR